jgi:hypothetical protein
LSCLEVYQTEGVLGIYSKEGKYCLTIYPITECPSSTNPQPTTPPVDPFS